MTKRESLDALEAIAWRDFILFAWSEPELREAFTKDTGVQLSPVPKHVIEAAIDEATGATQSIMTQFVEWATIRHYGLEYAPLAYQESLKQRKKSP